MSLTNAEKQTAHRDRMKQAGKQHLQAWIDAAAAQALADAAAAAGRTQAEHLELIIRNREPKPMKTFSSWSAAGICLSQYLSIGDSVDVALLKYVRDVMPPAYESNAWLAIGEPFSHDARGRPTFLTFYHATYRGAMAIEDMRSASAHPPPATTGE
jgi:hypothetical protein